MIFVLKTNKKILILSNGSCLKFNNVLGKTFKLSKNDFLNEKKKQQGLKNTKLNRFANKFLKN